MNWLLIGIIAVMILSVLYGYRKGFIRIMFSLVSIVILMVFVTVATPLILDFLENSTTLQVTIEEKCRESIQSSVGKNTETEMQNQVTDKQEILDNAGIQLPDGIWKQLLDSGMGAADEMMEASGIYESLAKSMSHFILNGIASAIALVIGVVALFIIARLLNIVARLPVIREVNHFLGVASGFILGMVIIWLFLYVVTISCTSSFGIMMSDYIRQSTILTWLYNNNVILYFIMMYL